MEQKRDTAVRLPYRLSLGAIGRYFDKMDCRGVFVAEVDSGYIGKAYNVQQEAELLAEGFTFPFEDVNALVASPLMDAYPPTDSSPNCVYGYGLFMQAVGELCDRLDASYVSILELTRGFVLCYSVREEGRNPCERRRLALDRDSIEEIMERATF